MYICSNVWGVVSGARVYSLNVSISFYNIVYVVYSSAIGFNVESVTYKNLKFQGMPNMDWTFVQDYV